MNSELTREWRKWHNIIVYETGRPPDYEMLRLLEVEGRTRRDMGDVPGAFAVVDEALELGGRVSDDIHARLEGGFVEITGIFARMSEKWTTRLRRPLDRTLVELLDLKAILCGSLLHDYEQAIAVYRRAYELAERTGDQGLQFRISFNRAVPLVRLKRYAEARIELDRALALVQGGDVPVLGQRAGQPYGYITPGDHLRVTALGGLANLNRLQGRLDEAAALYQEALSLRGSNADPSLGLNAMLGLGLVHLAHGDLARAREVISEAVARAEQLGAESFLRPAHLIAGKAYEQGGSPPELAIAHGHYARAVDLLEQTRTSLVDEAARMQFLGSEPRVEVYERMVVTCARLGRPAEAFEYAERGKARALLERLGGAEQAATLPLSYQAARELLTAARQPVLMLEYFTAPDEVVIVGLRADAEPDVVVAPLDRDALRRFTVANFGSAGQVRELIASGLEELWHSYDPLIAPVADWARPGELVVLVPHGWLHYLPLHALQVGGQYLIERHPVAYAPSASVLNACRRSAKTKDQGGWRAAVFGDPAGDLPYARDEARAVAALLHAEPRLGPAVTRAAFEAATSADVLHYAGHAVFNEVDPMGSGLYLAGGDILAARDIAALPGMRNRLVTLSGCETGVSWRHPGDELIGLMRGFLSTGAPTAMASLWRVPDDSTAYLMRRFYHLLRNGPEGTTKADALRRAMLDTRAHNGWSSLHHWAPFALIGDWE